MVCFDLLASSLCYSSTTAESNYAFPLNQIVGDHVICFVVNVIRNQK